MRNRKFYYWLLSGVILLCSCQSKNSSSNTSSSEEENRKSAQNEMDRPDETVEEIIEESFKSKDFDETKYLPIINELKGIEKYYVQNDLYRLHSLLKHKKDQRYKGLENDLEGKYEHPNYLIIHLIDTQNGYIKFERFQTECVQSMVYWNKTNGDKLIGHVRDCCTMFCESDIFFHTYSTNSNSFASIETKEVILKIDSIRSLRPDNHIEGDGFDYEFTLPQKGKNIQFCLANDCIELIWKDGTFASK